MKRLVAQIQALVRELRRRQVIRVGVVYATTGFVILQLAEILVDPFGLGPWALRLITLILVLGFPLAIGLAWVYNLTEEGVVEIEEEATQEDISGQSTVTSNGLIVGLLVIAIGLLLYPRFFSSGEEATGQGSSITADTAQVKERSIAVLPFEPLSGGEKSKTFARGIHDDLLTRLANISALRVISRTAVQQYRDTDLTTGEIADSLGVRWVMEGGVQVLQDQIQVNAQLIDPRSETHQWADDYRRDLTAEDLFAIQGDITGEIAEALQAKLTAGEQSRVTGAPTQDLKAYQLYIRGRTLLDRRTESSMEQAIHYFRRALRRDSTYALAWSGLADAGNLLVRYGHASADTLFYNPLEASRQAVKLDPELAEAHASLGGIYASRKNGPAALREYNRAIELKPSYARAYHWRGLLLQRLGQIEKGHASVKKAAKINPMSSPIQVTLANRHLAKETPEAALPAVKKGVSLSPDFATAYMQKGIVLSEIGENEEAITTLRRALEKGLGPSRTAISRAWLTIAHRRRGQTDQSQALLEKLKRESPFASALVYAERKQLETASSRLQKAYFGPMHTLSLRVHPPFSILRGDPRYDDLIRRLNRVWGLNSDGSLPENIDVSTSPTAR